MVKKLMCNFLIWISFMPVELLMCHAVRFLNIFVALFEENILSELLQVETCASYCC